MIFAPSAVATGQPAETPRNPPMRMNPVKVSESKRRVIMHGQPGVALITQRSHSLHNSTQPSGSWPHSRSRSAPAAEPSSSPPLPPARRPQPHGCRTAPDRGSRRPCSLTSRPCCRGCRRPPSGAAGAYGKRRGAGIEEHGTGVARALARTAAALTESTGVDPTPNRVQALEGEGWRPPRPCRWPPPRSPSGTTRDNPPHRRRGG